MADLSKIRLDASQDRPLYKQLADQIETAWRNNAIPPGERLPATRELAGQLGLNRTTVSAAYALLEERGILQGQVGRGSFLMERSHAAQPGRDAPITFANARPCGEAFPLEAFRRLAKQVIDSADAAEILQLGSPVGYGPLRRHLLEEASSHAIARPSDDLLVTNGCQQALDLLARVFASEGQSVAIENPVYHGLVRVFSRARANLLPVPVDESGLDTDALEQTLQQHRPRLLVVTPSFQNPTGATLPFERRKQILALAQRFGTVVIENDIYSELRYRGKALPRLKALDESGNTILLGSYSKVSFPGLRVGWAIAPKSVIARLAEAKQISDLHSDQLSQAVLLRFAKSGELARHLEKTRAAGAHRLEAVLRACARYLPPGASYTRPDGGMNLWIELPAPLTADTLLERAERRGVNFLPGRYFGVHGGHSHGLRISFGGLAPEEITRGIQILGETASRELALIPANIQMEPAAALV